MNLFNRIVVILVVLALMILIPLALVFPEQAQAVLRGAADIVQANIDWLNSLTQTGQIGVRLMLSAAGMVVFSIGVVFMVLEVIRLRRGTVRLKNGSGEVVMDGVAEHLAYYVDLLPDVLRVHPSVQSTGKSVSVVLYVDTAPGVGIPEKSSQVKQAALDVLETQLGLKVKGEVKVVIRPVPYPKGHTQGGAATTPSPQPSSETGDAGGEVIQVKAPTEEE